MTRTVLFAAIALSVVACGGAPGRDPDASLADVASSALDAPVSLEDAPAPPTADAPGLDAPGIDAWSPDAAPEPREDAAGSDAPVATVDPLQLAITVHLENGAFDEPWFDAFDEIVAIFEAHGALLTLEPREQVVTADARRATPSLPRLRARGHEIGLHAAVGTEPGATYASFVRTLRMRRATLEAHVGPVEHVSGNCATFDWVGGVAEAGFDFVTASTVYCLLAIPAASRPTGYRDLMCASAIDPVCHRSYPDTAAGTVHAWRASSGATWLTDDPTGEVVVLSSRGTLDCIVEELGGGPAGDCVLRDDDIAMALSELDEAVRVRDPSRPAQQYFIWSYGRALDPAALERFLSAVDERVARGEVVWATANDAYHSFVAWEATHR